MMIKIFMFTGIALSVAKANGWLIIPTFCIVFCWAVSIACVLMYCFVANIKEQIADKMLARYKRDGCCPVCGHKAGGADNG